MKLTLIMRALQGRALDEADWNLTRLQRWFYTVKVIICILLGWQQSRRWNEYRAGDYPITVEIFNCDVSGSDYPYCRVLIVGSYYFKNWWYAVESEFIHD